MNPLSFRIFRLLALIGIAIFCTPQISLGQDNCADLYILQPLANVRNEPSTNSKKIATLARNTSLICQNKEGQWNQVLLPARVNGWIRDDLISQRIIRIHNNERQLVVTDKGEITMSIPIDSSEQSLKNGRYFISPGPGYLDISWPNRRELRDLLKAGRTTYQAYLNALIRGPNNWTKNQLSLCPVGSTEKSCGAFLASGDYTALLTAIPNGARLEIYTDEEQDRKFKQPDEFSQQILAGALQQLKSPAAGLEAGGTPPRMAYPDGDIQPDFALSTDIVIRAVRHAGADLQALVHEDIQIHPERYEGITLGMDTTTSHRLAPVLQNYLVHNALSLPTNSTDSPFSFEAGDIVFFSTGEAGDNIPDKAGILSETYDRTGLPLIITVWDLGQSTGKKRVLGLKNQKVTGHFRLTHLFDYQ